MSDLRRILHECDDLLAQAVSSAYDSGMNLCEVGRLQEIKDQIQAFRCIHGHIREPQSKFERESDAREFAFETKEYRGY